MDDVQEKYDKAYSEFAVVSMRDEGREERAMENIKEMHDMADLLLHPPVFNDRDLYLYKKEPPT